MSSNESVLVKDGKIKITAVIDARGLIESLEVRESAKCLQQLFGIYVKKEEDKFGNRNRVVRTRFNLKLQDIVKVCHSLSEYADSGREFSIHEVARKAGISRSSYVDDRWSPFWKNLQDKRFILKMRRKTKGFAYEVTPKGRSCLRDFLNVSS